MAKKIEMPNITKDKKAAKGRELVYQGNPLIQSRKYFNTIGTRLFTLGLMGLNPHLSKNDKFFDEEFPHIFISTNELTKLFGDSKYLSMLEKECEKLFNSSITLKYTDKSFTLMHIFDVMEYKANDGLYIQFDPKMKKYLIELVEGGYTAVNIEQIFKLTSTYAVRLIELCLQYRNMTKGNVITRALTIDEIKFYLNVPDDAYTGRIDHFKQRVLDEPIAEIEKITDFRMKYHTEKEGRRIKNFVFELDLSKISEETFDINFTLGKKLPTSAPYADVYGELINQGFTAKAAKEILTAVNDNIEVSLRLEYALQILPESKISIKNKQGFLRRAILENWRVNDIKSKNAMSISEKSKVKNQMELNNLRFEKEKIQQRLANNMEAMEKTGIKSTDLQGNEQPIPAGFVKSISEMLASGADLPDSVQTILKAFNFTVERFKDVYMEKYQETVKTPSRAKFGANTRGFSSLADVLPNFA